MFGTRRDPGLTSRFGGPHLAAAASAPTGSSPNGIERGTFTPSTNSSRSPRCSRWCAGWSRNSSGIPVCLLNVGRMSSARQRFRRSTRRPIARFPNCSSTTPTPFMGPSCARGPAVASIRGNELGERDFACVDVDGTLPRVRDRSGFAETTDPGYQAVERAAGPHLRDNARFAAAHCRSATGPAAVRTLWTSRNGGSPESVLNGDGHRASGRRLRNRSRRRSPGRLDTRWSNLLEKHECGGRTGACTRVIPQLLPDVLEGRIEPGRVFDGVAALDEVPDGYRAMDERESIKVLVEL